MSDEPDEPVPLFFSAPREAWGEGPWQSEPDRVEWRHEKSGWPLLMVRNHWGAWCGYAGVPPGHPLHGKSGDQAELSAHGGITFTGEIPATGPGEPADIWWFGFDCAHGFIDYLPAAEALFAKLHPRLLEHLHRGTYWTLDMARAETEALGDQVLARAETPRGEGEA